MSPIFYWFLLLPVLALMQQTMPLSFPVLIGVTVVWGLGHLQLYGGETAGGGGSASAPTLDYDDWLRAVRSSNPEMGWNGLLFLAFLLGVFLVTTFFVVPHLGLAPSRSGKIMGTLPGALAAFVAYKLVGPVFHSLRR